MSAGPLQAVVPGVCMVVVGAAFGQEMEEGELGESSAVKVQQGLQVQVSLRPEDCSTSWLEGQRAWHRRTAP